MNYDRIGAIGEQKRQGLGQNNSCKREGETEVVLTRIRDIGEQERQVFRIV